MEPRKYSTGTKGRLKRHSDMCKEFVHAHTSFHLAGEFLETIDPERDERAWQRFQNVEDILPELQAWLDGSGGQPATPPAAPAHPALQRPEIKSGRHLQEAAFDAALQRTRTWLAGEEAGLAARTPAEAAEIALRRLSQEIAGAGPK